MKRYDALNAVNPGDPYLNANEATGDEGSFPDARGFDAVMTEIENAIAALGGVPANPDWAQLGAAIIAYVAAEIAAGGVGKVSKIGDSMTGALVLPNETVKAGAGTNGNVYFVDEASALRGILLWDRANQALRLYKYAADGVTLAASLSLFQSGKIEVSADPTSALGVATKQYVDAATLVPDATTSVKGKVQLVSTGVDKTLADATKALTAAALANVWAESAEVAITLGSYVNITNPLPVPPKKVLPYLRCKTADGAWAVGSEVECNFTRGDSSGHNLGMMAGLYDATNIRLAFNATNISIVDATGLPLVINTTKWNAFVRVSPFF